MTEAINRQLWPELPTAEANDLRQPQVTNRGVAQPAARAPQSAGSGAEATTGRTNQPWPLEPAKRRKGPTGQKPMPVQSAQPVPPHAPVLRTPARPESVAPVEAKRTRNNGGPPPDHPAPAKRSRGAFLYACVGFFAGVAFWHAVGFWSFVEEAVFSGPNRQATQSLNDFSSRPDTGFASRPSQEIDDEKRFATTPLETDTDASRISTGSISPVRPVKPVLPAAIPTPAAAAPADRDTQTTTSAPALESMRPGGLSWSPAVKTSE